MQKTWFYIITENENDTGTNLSKLYLSKLRQMEALRIRINCLKSGLLLKLYDYEGFEDVLKSVDYSFKDISKLESYILSRETQLRLLEAKYQQFDNSNKSMKYDFYDEVSKIENIYGKPGYLDIEKLTVKRWNHIVKNIKQGNGSEYKQR